MLDKCENKFTMLIYVLLAFIMALSEINLELFEIFKDYRKLKNYQSFMGTTSPSILLWEQMHKYLVGKTDKVSGSIFMMESLLLF